MPNMMYLMADSIWLALAFALAAHGDHQVERERGDFERDDQGDEVDAAHQHHQPGHAEGQEQVILGLHVLADVRQVAAQQQDEREAARQRPA